MPIKVYKDVDGRPEVAWLCDDCWELPAQIEGLGDWIRSESAKLKDGPYVADIGFSIRPEAFGGGVALEPNIMKLMVDADMSIFFSEYPDNWNDWMAQK
jgi:hypothetical protein